MPPRASAPMTRFCVPAIRNMIPISTPTVLIDASSNCSTTSATMIQDRPLMSQSHHSRDSSRKGSGIEVSRATMAGIIP